MNRMDPREVVEQPFERPVFEQAQPPEFGQNPASDCNGDVAKERPCLEAGVALHVAGVLFASVAEGFEQELDVPADLVGLVYVLGRLVEDVRAEYDGAEAVLGFLCLG